MGNCCSKQNGGDAHALAVRYLCERSGTEDEQVGPLPGRSVLGTAATRA
jgi:hypothetical protein